MIENTKIVEKGNNKTLPLFLPLLPHFSSISIIANAFAQNCRHILPYHFPFAIVSQLLLFGNNIIVVSIGSMPSFQLLFLLLSLGLWHIIPSCIYLIILLLYLLFMVTGIFGLSIFGTNSRLGKHEQVFQPLQQIPE
jgi:hypothetical protein